MWSKLYLLLTMLLLQVSRTFTLDCRQDTSYSDLMNNEESWVNCTCNQNRSEICSYVEVNYTVRRTSFNGTLSVRDCTPVADIGNTTAQNNTILIILNGRYKRPEDILLTHISTKSCNSENMCNGLNPKSKIATSQRNNDKERQGIIMFLLIILMLLLLLGNIVVIIIIMH